MKKLVIVGFGRFGKLLAELTGDTFEVSVVEMDSDKQKLASAAGYQVVSVKDISAADYVFLAVPISALESTIKQMAPYTTSKQVVSDVCSVKVYPARLMQQYLSHCQIIAMHPLFGPDSASRGLQGLKLVLCQLGANAEHVAFWKGFWRQKGIEVTESTPEEHDKDSVYSQAFTYSIARMISEMRIPPLRFTTRSYDSIKEVADLSANDSEQLFHDMLYYNPYFSEMKAQLEAASAEVLAKLDEIEEKAVQRIG